MKTIEVDEDLYRYIAGHTLHIGESASDILRRLLKFTPGVDKAASPAPAVATAAKPSEKSESVRPLPGRVRAMRELLLSDDYALQRKVVDRFMLVLTTLHTLSPQAFAEATETLHGRTRTYFAVDRQTLLQSGHQTKPKQVPGTSYWVITNTNSDRKRSMIEHIMLAMQFPTELIEKVCGTLKFH